MRCRNAQALLYELIFSYEGELDEDSTDSKLRPGILCNLFRAFSNRALSSRALALNLTRERVRVATLSEASLSMVVAFMSIGCDSESSLLSL